MEVKVVVCDVAKPIFISKFQFHIICHSCERGQSSNGVSNWFVRMRRLMHSWSNNEKLRRLLDDSYPHVSGAISSGL